MNVIRSNGAVALGAAAFIAASAATAAAAPGYVLSTVNLRSSPGTTNEIIGKIPAGSLVDVASCTDWCEVTWKEKTGFAIKSAIDTSGRVPVRRTASKRLPPPGGPVVAGTAIDVGPPVYYGGPVVYPYYAYRPYGCYRPYGYRVYRRW